MRRTLIVTVTILVGILIIGGGITYFVHTTPNDDAHAKASQDLAVSSSQVYTDLQGNPFTFESFEGKVRVVNSWASWTPFSSNELKNFEKLATEYPEDKVVVIAINRKEPKEFAVAFLKTLQDFSHIEFAIDLTDSFYASVGGFAMPETVFYDARGNVTFHKHGDMTFEEMKTYTDMALGDTK